MKHLHAVALTSALLAISTASMAAVDPSVTAAVTAFTSGFTDNFAPVAIFVVGIVVTVTVFKMVIGYFKRNAK